MPEDNTSVSSEPSSSQGSKRYPVIPDGGYGWVITFASFMCHFIADGIAFSFGVIYTELLDEFQASKSATSWVGSLFVGVPLICAPIAGLFVNRYGCRITTIIGGIVSAVGLTLSSYAINVEMMSVSFGVISGFGLAFVYVPASVIPSFWFEKKRSLATGIAVSGSGVGTFAMAPAMEYLIEEYGWRGAMLILAGITANIVVFGSLFRPAPESDELTSNLGEEPLRLTEVKCPSSPTKSTKDTALSLSTWSIPAKLFVTQDHQLLVTRDSADEPLMLDNSAKAMAFSAETLNSLKPVKLQSRRHTHSQSSAHPGIPQNQLKRADKSLIPLSRRDITSVLTLAEKKRMSTSCPELSVISTEGTTSSAPKRARIVQLLKKIRLLGQEMCDVRLFKVPVYFLFFMSNFIMSYAYDLPYVYIPDYATELGIANGSFLISIVGIVNMFGQILYGYLGDHKKVNTIILYGVSIVGCGVLIALIPLLRIYSLLATACGLFGFLISANFSLETIVVVQILSLDELTKAYSLLMFGQGIAALIGPPIGGLLWDMTQTYTATFIFSGVSLVLSGLLVLAILPSRRSRTSRTRDSSFSSGVTSVN